jgi:hypothetical protein
MMSEWPPQYFVVECTTTSAPAERLLKVRRGKCRRRRQSSVYALNHIAAMSAMASSGW